MPACSTGRLLPAAVKGLREYKIRLESRFIIFTRGFKPTQAKLESPSIINLSETK
ncbi:MAG: hypothetical protein ACI8XZ_001300 [Gammaproteobacteria bacterium]|jgi:hypothetical protein